MIALDTSALAAIIFLEPEAEGFDRTIASQTALIGAPTLFEVHQVVHRRSAETGLNLVEHFLLRPTVRVVTFGLDHFRLAAAAFDRYGKGRGHPAQLNFGDCMAYAVAKAHGVPLLYKGDDFARTDIASAA
ncbi:MAG TPA: type II toxin-antitoxin system VapC family toxin [Beijerinckiaceae bacterium]